MGDRVADVLGNGDEVLVFLREDVEFMDMGR